MKKVSLILVLILFLSAVHISTASEDSPIDYEAYRKSWDPTLQSNKSQQNCVDNSILYARENTGWFFVTMSPDPNFRHQAHMANCKIEGNLLIIHDTSFQFHYEIEIVNKSITIPYHLVYPETFDKAWEGETYFHIYENEEDIVRRYITTIDNRNEFFDYKQLQLLK